MEQRTENNLVEVEPKKSGRGQYERKARGSYIKHKLEKKVSVKHFVNVNEDEKECFTYTLAVQCIFNKKTATIKSSIIKDITDDEEYEMVFKDELWKDILNRECLYIKTAILLNYERHLKALENNYDKRHNNNLDLSEKKKYITSSLKEYDGTLKMGVYQYFLYKNQISRTIDRMLIYRMMGFASKIDFETLTVNYNPDNVITLGVFMTKNKKNFPELYNAYDSVIDSKEDINASVLLNFLEKKYPIFSEFRKIFPSEIWYFSSIYYPHLKKDILSYQFYGATMVDYFKGEFKANFLKVFLNEKDKIEMIIKDIDKLFENESYLI